MDLETYFLWAMDLETYSRSGTVMGLEFRPDPVVESAMG